MLGSDYECSKHDDSGLGCTWHQNAWNMIQCHTRVPAFFAQVLLASVGGALGHDVSVAAPQAGLVSQDFVLVRLLAFGCSVVW